ncbi:hypothetical protein GNAINCEL_00074 [Serratia phage KKP 3709]|nr:hypothetical protein GNAINCEL_00074 [Serratia phage KKP 3709]
MKLTIDIIVASTGATRDVASKWLNALQAACDKYEINNRRRVAMFMANLGVESGGLTQSGGEHELFSQAHGRCLAGALRGRF